ncbi:hypothetical protein REPUB_Repub01dG0195400 [Reevesia pubescens]
MEIKDQKGEQWRITTFYDEPNVNKRYNSWTTLTNLASCSTKPLLCLGDFNEILWDMKKSGKCLRSQWQIENFKKALDDAELMDLGYTGTWFTWERERCSETLIKERLDRACLNKEWSNLFPNSIVKHSTASILDHFLIIVDTEGGATTKRGKSKHKCIFFEELWTIEE